MIESAESDARQREPHDQPPPDRGREIAPEIPALGLVRPLAVIAAIAMILGRLAGPASTGLVVGFGRVTRGVELAGAIATQVFAMAATVVAMAEIIAATKSKLPMPLRLGAITVGGFAIIVGLSAAVLRVPGTSAAILGVGASILAIAAAWDASRAPFARAFAVALGVLAAAGLAHLAAAGLSELATARGSMRIATIARGAATGSLMLDASALLGVMAILASGSKKLTSPFTLAALALAFVATRQALIGDTEDAGVVSIFLRRAADRLMARPDTFFPITVHIFISYLALFAAVFALFIRGQVPALTGALALALLARGAPDMPLGGMILIIAALSMALAARDDRGVWASIIHGRAGSAGGAIGDGRHPGEADGPPIKVPHPEQSRAIDDREEPRPSERNPERT